MCRASAAERMVANSTLPESQDAPSGPLRNMKKT